MPSQPLLFAFLNHPAMLGWLVAAAAPLIIHLLSKRKHREMQWAAMQYLLAALRHNARRIRIEQWLLLAIRTLLVVLLVLAVAEPYLEQAGLAFVSGQRTHKVLVLDASYSMAYKPADKSRFERAKELAARIVDEGSQGDGYTLVLLADPPRVVVGTPAFEPHDFLEEIDALKLLHGGADLPATLAEIEKILKSARREHARLVREEVYFLTDLGRNTWRPDPGARQAVADFRQQIARIARAARVVVADLGQPAAENLAVTSLSPLEPYATLAGEISFEAEIRNFGQQPRTRQLVELFVDGRRAGEDRVDLEPESSAAVLFPYRFDASGDHQVEVRLPADALAIDNHRWLALPVAGRLNVLCVNGRPAGGPFQGATDYLVVALAPHGETDERSPVRPQVVPESALVELDLDQYDCILLADVGRITSNEARLLESYIRQGGGVVFFLGDQVQPSSYNEHRLGAEGGLLPARLDEKVVSENPHFFDPRGYRHPLIAPFRSRERAGLLTTPVYGYFKLSLDEGAKSRVALAFDNGDPAVVEAPLGRGRSILVATSADTSWTIMPVLPSYLPLVRELVSLAVGGRIDERNVLVGRPLGASVDTLATDVQASLRTPAGQRVPIRLTTSDDESRWNHAETNESGFYRAEFAAPLSSQQLFAVNVDTTESDLARIDMSELESEVWPGVPFEQFDSRDPLAEPAAPSIRRNALHRWILLAVLGLLFTETTLASYFGRRAA